MFFGVLEGSLSDAFCSERGRDACNRVQFAETGTLNREEKALRPTRLGREDRYVSHVVTTHSFDDAAQQSATTDR